MKFGPAVFREDTELSEPFSSMGPTIAKGNLKVHSITTYGPLTARRNLDVEYKVKVNGPLIVDETLTCYDDCVVKVNGPMKVGKGIQGGSIKVNGPIEAEYLDVVKLKVNGPVKTNGDIIAEEEIKLGIGFSTSIENFFEIGGLIEAPTVHFKGYGKLSDKIPGYKTLKKALGFSPKYSGKIIISGLRIKTNLLRLEGVELIDSEIEADEIEEISSI